MTIICSIDKTISFRQSDCLAFVMLDFLLERCKGFSLQDAHCNDSMGKKVQRPHDESPQEPRPASGSVVLYRFIKCHQTEYCSKRSGRQGFGRIGRRATVEVYDAEEVYEPREVDGAREVHRADAAVVKDEGQAQ
jgi:hypothetical protein